MRTTGRKGESASLLLGVRMGSGSLDLGERMWVLRRISAAFAAKSDRAGGAFATSRGAGARRRRKGTRPAGPLAALADGLAGLCRAGFLTGPSRRGKCQFRPTPERGGKCQFSPTPERGGKCQFRPRRKGGESAIFGAGGDQPPLATSRRCCLAAARLCVPPSDPAAEAGGLPGSTRPSGGCSDGG